MAYKKIKPLFFWRKLRAIYSFLLIGFLLPIALFTLHQPEFIRASNVVLIFPILWLFFLLHPSSKQKISEDISLPWLHYFSLIALTEICVLIFICALLPALKTYMPNISVSNALITNHFSLVPWSLYALTAMIIGYYYGKHQQAANPAVMLPHFNNTHLKAFLGRIVLGIVTSLNMVCQYLFLIGITLALTTLVLSHYGIKPEVGSHVNLIVLYVIYLGVIINPEPKALLQYLLSKKINIIFIILLILGFIFLSVVIANSFHTELSFGFNSLGISSKPISKSLSELFCLALGVAITPTIAAFIVLLSKGRSMRSMLFTVMVLPILFTIFLSIKPQIISQLHYLLYLSPMAVLFVGYGLYKTNHWFVCGLMDIPGTQDLIKSNKTKRTNRNLISLLVGFTTIILASGGIPVIKFIIATCPILLVIYGLGIATYFARQH